MTHDTGHPTFDTWHVTINKKKIKVIGISKCKCQGILCHQYLFLFIYNTWIVFFSTKFNSNPSIIFFGGVQQLLTVFIYTCFRYWNKVLKNFDNSNCLDRLSGLWNKYFTILFSCQTFTKKKYVHTLFRVGNSKPQQPHWVQLFQIFLQICWSLNRLIRKIENLHLHSLHSK